MGLLRDIFRKLGPEPASGFGFRPDFSPTEDSDKPTYTLGEGNFFESADQLRSNIAAVLANYPEWVERNRRYVEQRRQRGLPVYGEIRGPLDGDFDWRGQRDHADLLYECRPHRFAFAPKLALASAYGHGELVTLQRLLSGWITAVEGNRNGAAFFSSLVVAQRLFALSWTLHFVQASPEPTAVRQQVTSLLNAVLAEDCRYLEQVTGTAYPNNHLLLEYFAGWYSSLLFPAFFRSAETFGHQCRKGLDQEIMRQVCADGSGFEQASHYSELATEALVAYSLLATRNGIKLTPEVAQRLQAALDFQATAIAGPGASLHLGNATEDPLFPLDPGDAWMGAGWQILARQLIDYPMPVVGETLGMERAFWLLGGHESPALRSQTTASPGHVRHWPDAGLTLFHHPRSAARLLFRSGPGHSRFVPGHMHFDWLGIYLSDASRPWILDAGTYTYRAKPEALGIWKQYFVGAAAHNGILLDGDENLPIQRGDFPATQPECRAVADSPIIGEQVAAISAVIEGNSPYAGIRRGVISIPGTGWLIWQVMPEFPAAASPSAPLQFAPDIECGDSTASVRTASGETAHLDILVSDGMQRMPTHKGSMAPIAGWVSDAYGKKLPAPRMQWRLAPGVSAMLLAFRDGTTTAQALECDVRDGYLHFGLKRGGGDLHLYLGGDGKIADEILESEARLIMLETGGDGLRRLLQIGPGKSHYHADDLDFTLAPDPQTTGFCGSDPRCRANRINSQEVEVIVNA